MDLRRRKSDSLLVSTEGKSMNLTRNKLSKSGPKSEFTFKTRSLIQFYPNFEDKLRESLRAIVGGDVEKRVEIGLAKDGSGVGGERHSIMKFPYSVDVLFRSCFMCAPSNQAGAKGGVGSKGKWAYIIMTIKVRINNLCVT